MIPGLFVDTLGELAEDPARLALLVGQFALVDGFSLFAVELALELIGSSENPQQVHQGVALGMQEGVLIDTSVFQGLLGAAARHFKLTHLLLVDQKLVANV